MAVSKKEQFEQETAIFQCRAEMGLLKMRDWLYARRDQISNSWMDLTGDDLTKIQGEARLIKKQIKLLEQGPTIKETEQ